MKRHFLSCLVLALVLVCATVFAVACDNGSDGDAETTDAVTTEPTTEAPEPTVTLTAAEVDAMIAEIGGATLENEDKIDEAYLAYWSLDDAERAKVTGYDTLQGYRYELTKAYVVKEYKDTRIPHNEIIIGGYHVPEVNETNLQALVDCHFDFIWSPTSLSNREGLDLIQQYGLGVFMAARSTGLPVNFTITEEAFREAIANAYPDHETVWLIDHCDEPNHNMMIDLWRTGKIISEELFPHSAYIQNMLPNYANSDHLEEDPLYSRTYVNAVATFTDIICFDHYLYAPENDSGLGQGNNRLSVWFDELDLLSSWCMKYDKDLYAIIQNVDVWHPSEPEYEVTTDMMKLQAYTAMAYGAKSLSYYYTGNYGCFVLNADGTRNEMFDKLEETNGDVKALEPIYMRYTAKSNVLLYDEKSPLNVTMEPYAGNKDVTAMDQTSLTDIAVGEKNAVLIGAFEKNVGEGEAFMLVGCNNYRFNNNKEQLATVTFKTVDPDAVVTAYVKGIPTVLTPDENGTYTVEIHDADAVFLTVDYGMAEGGETGKPNTDTDATTAAEIEVNDGLLLQKNADGTAYSVVGMTEDNTALEIVIPASYNELPVTALGEKAFAGKLITAVTIPEGVTEIGPWCFASCTDLASVTIPASVTLIDDGAFCCCTDLDTVTFNEGVTTIGKWAFAGCEDLTAAAIPNSVTLLDFGAFSGCIALSSVTLSDELITVGSYAFANCISLTAIDIPDKVTDIERWAFYSCSALADVTLGSSLETLGWGAFNGCAAITEIVLPEGLTTIVDSAFAGCRSLTSVVIPDSVTTLSSGAFSGCTALTSAVVPAGIETMGGGIFSGCSALTDVTLKEGLTAIAEGMFQNCTALTSVTIPTSVTTIEKGAFNGCVSLTGLVLPEGVTAIGASAFQNCAALTELVIPATVTRIDSNALQGCTGLTSVILPIGVTFVEEGILQGCTAITDVYCAAESKPNNWHEDWLGDCAGTVHWAYTAE